MDLKNIENNIWDNIDLNLDLIKKIINQNNQYLIHYAVINSNLEIIKKIIHLDENNILFINKEIFINIAKLGKFNFILKLLEIVNSKTKKYILDPFINKEEENEWILFYFLYNANFDYINELFKYNKYIYTFWNLIIDNNYCLKIYLLKNYKNISDESYNIFLKILENTDLKKLSEDYCSIIIDSCLFGFNKRVLDKIIEVFPESVNIIKSNQLSPLLAAINRQNNELVNYLLDNGANYNYNTYINPLIFAIKLNNNELVKRLLKYKDIEINFFDLNKWQAVHHIFNKSELDIELKKEIILKTDNLNIQNTSGNTAIHLMFLNENWRDYIEQLKDKIIDIYCKNKLELSPLDNLIIKIKDNDMYNYQYEIDSLLQLVASSFLTNTKRLTYNGSKISKNLSRLGSSKRSGNANVLYNLSLKCLKNETSNCINSLARKIEKLKISKIDADTDNDKIDLISGDKTDYNLFVSRDVDSYIYLLYFIEKYKIGILSESKDNLIIKIKKPEIAKIINFYVGISNKYNNIKNLSIYWHDKNNNVFPNNLSSLPSIKKNIILILVTIINPEIDHANCLIIDKKNKRIVHFEPYGRVNKQNLKDFDNTCIAIFEKIFPDFKYFKPDDYMTQNSFQMLSNETNPLEAKTGDIGGFCLAWTLWFFELYLRNPNVDLSNLVNNSISKIINSKYSFMEYIRFYANKLRRFHIKFLKKIKYPVEKIFNIHTTVNEKDYIYNSINNHIGKYI